MSPKLGINFEDQFLSIHLRLWKRIIALNLMFTFKKYMYIKSISLELRNALVKTQNILKSKEPGTITCGKWNQINEFLMTYLWQKIVSVKNICIIFVFIDKKEKLACSFYWRHFIKYYVFVIGKASSWTFCCEKKKTNSRYHRGATCLGNCSMYDIKLTFCSLLW